MDKKCAVLTSHVIQYQTPLFKQLNFVAGLKPTIYFCWDFGAKKSYDVQFKREIEWDIPLLDGYTYKFLKNYSPKPSSSYWWGEINLGIVQEIFRGKYDFIIVYGWTFVTNWLAFFAAILTRTPILLHSENPLRQELEKSFLKRFLKFIVLGTLFRFVRGFLYIGEENKKFYEYYGVPEERLFFTPYAVDNKRLEVVFKEKDKKRKGLRRELNIAENAVVILFVGKLMPKKRPMDLLCAFEILTTNYKLQVASFLIFVGDGELRVELEEYVKLKDIADVKFVGFKNQTELPEYYAVADIFVLPSGVGETWGLVVNEAMVFGLPVIVSDIVGCGPDLVKEGKNGHIFPFGDVTPLAKYLEILIQNEKSRLQFSKKSREIIYHYTHEQDIKGILEAINVLAN